MSEKDGASGFIRLLMVNESANADELIRRNALLVNKNGTDGINDQSLFLMACQCISESTHNFEIYFLGDALYYWLEDITDFINVSIALRYYLLKEGYYFKASIIPKKFQPESAVSVVDSIKPLLKTAQFNRLKKSVSGISIDSMAIELLENEELFKGVGFNISQRYIEEFQKSIKKQEGCDVRLVPSMFQSSANGYAVKKIYDLKFNVNEVGLPVIKIHEDEGLDSQLAILKTVIIEAPKKLSNLKTAKDTYNKIKESLSANTTPSSELRKELDNILKKDIKERFDCINTGDGGLNSRPQASDFLRSVVKNFLKAVHKSDAYARFYIPLFITIIESSDFSDCYFDEKLNKWQLSPIIMDLVINKVFISTALKNKSFTCVYLVLLSKVLKKSTQRGEGVTENDKLEMNKTDVQLIKSFTRSQLKLVLSNKNEDLMSIGLRNYIASIRAELDIWVR